VTFVCLSAREMFGLCMNNAVECEDGFWGSWETMESFGRFGS
jgi:hypothetical protein